MNWEQFRAILWLRWRLTRNQLARGTGVGTIIATLAAVVVAILMFGLGIGGTLLGALALGKVSSATVMFVWDGVTIVVMFIWLLSVVTELQRSESVDLTRLLHLPVSLKQVFVFNYLVSLVSFGTLMALSGMVGLVAGLSISRGPSFLLALPLVLCFVFMVTAWIYCLRGWLLSIMINPRRRRAIIMWLTLGIILLGQSPQLLNVAWQRKARAEREARRATQRQPSNHPAARENPRVVAASKSKDYYAAVAAQIHPWVPLLWLSNGARGLATGEFLPTLWGGGGMFVLGCLGLSRAYGTTVRFYRGDDRARPTTVRPLPKKNGRRSRNWVASHLPWVSDDIAAMALAQLRSMTRAPEVRMMLAMGVFVAIFVPPMIAWRGGSNIPLPELAKPFIGTGTVVMVLLALLQLTCNMFGCDRDGFRSLVLLPTPRERLLFGKNLALVPLSFGIALLPLAVTGIFAKLSVLVLLATALQFTAAFFIFCAVGNLTSIMIPYRIAAGSLKPTKQSWRIQLLLFLVHLLFPLVVAPVFLPPALGWMARRWVGLPAGLVNCIAALVLVGAFGVIYWITLAPFGRLLQRRETHILRAVTEEAE